MLLVNIHKLDVILADPVGGVVLEDEVDDIRRILGLDSENIVVLGGAKDFGKGAEVDAEGNIAIAAEGLEGFRAQEHGDKGNMGVVHGLERDARVIAVEIAVLDEVLDCVDNLGYCQM